MLADLFKPAWKSGSVEKRLKAIAAMDSANLEQQKILDQLASDDEDATICIAAIQKLSSAPALHQISLKHANDTVRTEASNRLNELMGESASLSPQQFDDILKLYPELKVRVAAHAEAAAVRNQAIQGMSAEQLLEVLLETTYTDSRQQIANMLLDVESLDSARKVMRGKDKNAERIVKTKLDEFRRQEREQAENLVTVNELIEEVEYLSSRDGLPEFKTRCQAHCNRWDNLDVEIDNELKQRYQAARSVLDTRYQELVSIEKAKQSQQEKVDELQSLLKAVARRDLKNAINQLSETYAKRDQIISSWQSLALITIPEQRLSDQYLEMKAALQVATQFVEKIDPLFSQEQNTTQDNISAQDKLEDLSENNENSTSESTDTVPQQQSGPPIQPLGAALKKLKWPLGYGVLKIETELRNQLAEWQKAQQDEAEKHEKKLAQVHKNISSIFHFSRIGNLVRAKQMCVRVEKALDKFSGKDRTALNDRFEEARLTLGDISDWKNFATEPKYVELCEAMEQLVDSKLHPDKLTKDMKALQQQWKELGNSDISDQYWPRFKQAADAVYKPCAIFFEERHKQRKANLAQRQKYVVELRELLEQTNDENNPDYKIVESSLRSINDRFISIKDVERNPGQKQWVQFTKVKDEIFTKLDVVYDANIELKQKLIEQAEALA